MAHQLHFYVSLQWIVCNVHKIILAASALALALALVCWPCQFDPNGTLTAFVCFYSIYCMYVHKVIFNSLSFSFSFGNGMSAGQPDPNSTPTAFLCF
jgi:hypothetical protein